MQKHIPLSYFANYSDKHCVEQAEQFKQFIEKRRSVREFSSQAVDKKVIEFCIQAANSAPSGANMQPWHFVAVSNRQIKSQIRKAAEKEEKEFYTHRASEEWLQAIQPLGTNYKKPFLETAPWLIAVFAKRYGIDEQGNRIKHYYTPESVGIACGFLLTALHNCGLATLTHTPSPMGFLRKILNRPGNERPYLLIVCGHPAKDATVPDIKKRPLSDVSTFFD